LLVSLKILAARFLSTLKIEAGRDLVVCDVSLFENSIRDFALE
jgi:hypothetical protein